MPGTIHAGRSPTTRSTRSITGSKRPASDITPKNRIANTNIAATGAMPWMPAVTSFPVSRPKPPTSAAAIGTRISATSGVAFRSTIRACSARIVSRPRIASMAAGC